MKLDICKDYYLFKKRYVMDNFIFWMNIKNKCKISNIMKKQNKYNLCLGNKI